MTIAESLVAQGRQEGELQALHATLLLLLGKRFGKVPRKTAAAITACDDIAQLNLWLERVVEVRSLVEMGITS